MENINSSAKIVIADRDYSYKGFWIKKGFITLVDKNNNVIAVTSGQGYYHNDRVIAYLVYRPNSKGGWTRAWENEDIGNFPVEKINYALEAFKEDEEFSEAVEQWEQHKKDGIPLFVSDDEIELYTDCSICKTDGTLDYTENTIFTPVNGYPGLYYEQCECCSYYNNFERKIYDIGYSTITQKQFKNMFQLHKKICEKIDEAEIECSFD